jgi:uncharacterized protein (TIGR01777 family)
MRVIITGGTGLIGSALSKHLADTGHEVVVLSRSPERHAGKMPKGVRVVGWDAQSAAGWGELADGAGAIVNLAGAGIADGRWSDARKKAILQSRLNAGKAVVEAIEAAQQKPGVLIQSSAVGYYGGGSREVKTESAPAGADFMAKVCASWEDSTAAVEAMGVRRVIIRTGIVLDEDEGALPKMLMPFKLFAGGPVGNGQQPLPWIHIDDEVRAIAYAITNESMQGPYNLTSPEKHDNESFGKVIGKVMHRPAFMPAPSFAMRLIFGEMADVLLEGQQAVPDKLQDAGFSFEYPTAESALREILS